MFTLTLTDSNGVAHTLDVTPRQADRPFSSGKVGYNVNGKVTIDGKRHQVSANFVEIGSSLPVKPNKARK